MPFADTLCERDVCVLAYLLRGGRQHPRGHACRILTDVDEPFVLQPPVLNVRLAPGHGKGLQAGAGLGRLLAGQVSVAAPPHQRKL